MVSVNRDFGFVLWQSSGVAPDMAAFVHDHGQQFPRVEVAP
jgi:hypothetical protein